MTREEAIWYVNHTFEVTKEELCNNGRFDEAKEFEIAKNMAIEALSAERTGEWIDRGWKGDWQFETDGRGHCWKVFECSVCNGKNTIKTRFCPNCGAKMGGDTE